MEVKQCIRFLENTSDVHDSLDVNPFGAQVHSLAKQITNMCGITQYFNYLQ